MKDLPAFPPKRTMILDLACLVAIALALRLLRFSGLGLSDDTIYFSLMNPIFAGDYPRIDVNDPFASRPLLLYGMVFCIKLFGRHEIAAVLPFLIASLLEVVACYVIASRFFGRWTAGLASLVFIFFPLDWVFSTKICNDILGAGILWGGVALCLASLDQGTLRRPRWMPLTGGFLIGMSLGVKNSFAFACGPLFLSLVLWAWPRLGVAQDVRQARRRTAYAIVIGCAVALCGLALFFIWRTGNPLGGLIAEMQFTRTYWLQHRNFREDGLFYPRLWAGLWRPYEFANYGLFFLLGLPAAVFGFFSSQRGAKFLAFVFWTTILIFQFWPIQIFPEFIFMQRMSRFMAIVGVPGAILIACGAVRLFQRNRIGQLLAISFMTGYFLFSWRSASAGARTFSDAQDDARYLTQVLQANNHVPYVMHPGLQWFPSFRMGPQAFHRWLRPYPEDLTQVSSGTLVAAGGAHGIDLDPGFYVLGIPRPIPSNWTELGRSQTQMKSYRLAPLRVWLVTSPPLARKSLAPPPPRECGPGKWTWVDTVRPGHPASRARHRIGPRTWDAVRRIQLRDRTFAAVDGNAVEHSQEFMLTNLQPGKDVCVVEETNSNKAAALSTQWQMNHEESVPTILKWSESAGPELPLGGDEIGYLVSRLPGSQANSRMMTFRQTIRSELDALVVYRIDVYQLSL